MQAYRRCEKRAVETYNAQVREYNEALRVEHGERATLQFVYEYLTRTKRLELDDDAFDATFEAFIGD